LYRKNIKEFKKENKMLKEVIKILNRQQRRQIERETKQQTKDYNDNLKWYENLSNSKKAFIGWMIEQGVIKNEDITMAIIDECFQAAMISELDLDLKTTEKIVNKTSEFMVEMKSILEKEGREYLNMIKDETLRSEIKDEAKKILQTGQVISRTVSELRKRPEYKHISVKDMQILCAEVKQETNESISTNATGELKANLANECEHGFEITLDKTGTKLNGLKIKSIEIEGENGRVYIKDSVGVKIGDKFYKDISDLEKERQASKEDIKERREDLRNRIEAINELIGNLDEFEREEIEKYAEIEAVFAM
jgi:hypothetical protein